MEIVSGRNGEASAHARPAQPLAHATTRSARSSSRRLPALAQPLRSVRARLASGGRRQLACSVRSTPAVLATRDTPLACSC
ncbi:hypothetical protein PR202_ga27817 [Eleusine coracana subsp. coracana]|uniref:Uncharacterized protein n=1 Tax=Eleusine coracana subsp. coracana TaxID=191504 RepID=A0AAV5DGY3_ELECO|nr:hypothetical protein PR202_ga27817 [Eleusine coracana subsp. coracana]